MQNDPEFRNNYDKQFTESNLEEQQFQQQMKERIVNQQKKSYANFSDHKKVDEVALEKVAQTMMGEEQAAISGFKQQLKQDKNSSQTESPMNPAVYRAIKSKKKSSAEIYAKLTKENAEQLQEKAIDAQKRMLQGLCENQQKFEAKTTKYVLQKENEILKDTCNMLLDGLAKIIGNNKNSNANSSQSSDRKSGKENSATQCSNRTEKESELNDLDTCDSEVFSNEFYGIDSSNVDDYFQ